MMGMSSQVVNVPDDFPREATTGVVSGAQPKVCAVLSGNRYVADQTDAQREERWNICEDLAHQLAPKARKDFAAHPEHSHDETLRRVRIAVVRKGWVSDDELTWMLCRLRELLAW